MRTLETWTVMPHGDLRQLDRNILSVVGRFRIPLGEAPRRMTVVRLKDGRLVVFSAIALDEDEMQRIESFGRLAFLVVPSGTHRIDAKIWKDRYPSIEVVAPKGAREKIEKVVRVDATAATWDDQDVRLEPVAGTEERELALTVRTGAGTTLVVNDLIFGSDPGPRGLRGFLRRLMGVSGSSPRIPKVIRMAIVKDAAAVKSQLERWSNLTGLERVLVAHGATIEARPASALRALAASL